MTPNYLLIGRGRLATHLFHWLPATGHDIRHRWSASLDPREDLLPRATQCSHILIATSDRKIPDLIQALKPLNKTLIHFSGALTDPDAIAVHPLMTFPEQIYDLSDYVQIPFSLDRDDLQLKDLFPNFENPSFVVPPKQRLLYHALCASGGNLSQLLWAEVEKIWSTKLGLPADLLRPYQRRCLENLIQNGASSITGALVRGDQQTVKNHYDVLQGTPLKKIYETFEQELFQ